MSTLFPKLYKRITASVPLMVTVIVHVVLALIATYFVVSTHMTGKKKSFEGVVIAENVAQKEQDHRLKISRKGGGSASNSPVSANRIFSADKNALQMAAPPELNTPGQSALAGVGGGFGQGGAGSGSGYNTGNGLGNGLGNGFMSMSFLGMTSNKASKVVFIIDAGRFMMDIKKGGFLAFSIIREEIMKLVSKLPPSCEFGLVVYESSAIDRDGGGSSMAPFSLNLLPATSANKMKFFEWMKPINLDPDNVGMSSVPTRIAWTARPLPDAGLDTTLVPPMWVKALHCALEMGANTIFVVSGSPGVPVHMLGAEGLAELKAKQDQRNENALSTGGQTIESITAARRAFVSKVTGQITQLNVKLKSEGKTPVIIPRNEQRIFEDDFLAMLRKKGLDIKLNTKGWSYPNGDPVWDTDPNKRGPATYDEVAVHIGKLQRALLRDKATINIFYLVGPTEEPQRAVDDYTKVTSRNGGRFQLITTRKLQEIVDREDGN